MSKYKMELHCDGFGINRDDHYGSRVMTLEASYKGLDGFGAEVSTRWNTYPKLTQRLKDANQRIADLSAALREATTALPMQTDADYDLKMKCIRTLAGRKEKIKDQPKASPK